MQRHISISIPDRWRSGSIRIKQFIEHYTQAVGRPVSVNVAAESHNPEIWLADAGDLGKEEYEAVDNAIQTLNEGLSRLHGELPWETRTEGLLHRLDKISRI